MDSYKNLHVGFIMDGNGRWAEEKSKSRSDGHLEGLKATKKLVEHASKLSLKALSLYVFSTENWKRTTQEVGYLMDLIVLHLKNEYEFYKKNQIRVVHSGELSKLPIKVQEEIKAVEQATANFNGLVVNLLINYGGHDEICRACNKVLASNLPINEENISNNLDQSFLCDVDLVIRTAGEQRLSNFMIWQTRYAEYSFTKTLWPDFLPVEFEKMLEDFTKRNRRFGGYNK